ncbi:TPA: NUDIX hydrolase [Candidatus Saccharibacteria bacterium]|nr:NUDIX hydrolase [Candidatus Saccharibacteria bacterium]HIO88052.1 NUDIX hydrolase [Candidatus Saccharibacteria bacterium]
MSIYAITYKCVRLAQSIVPLSTRRVRVALICERRILLIKNRLGDDNWTLPGGGLKKGERPATAAKREIQEELSIDIGDNKLTRFSTEKKQFGLYKESYVVYATAIDSLKYKANKTEIRESRWFELEGVPRRRDELVDVVMKTLEVKR